MIKKAPKDMTAPEFVEYYAAQRPEFRIPICEMRKLLSEPAPNPFTEDQLAWMREMQRDGLKYAAVNPSGMSWCFKDMPHKIGNLYWSDSNDSEVINIPFLRKALSWDDPEPLCFADYAPLEGK